VQTRSRKGLVLLAIVLAAALAGGLVWLWKRPPAVQLGSSALDAIPSGALLVATVDLKALRASPVGAPFFREGREIRGLGKLRDLCGFDPIDTLQDVAIAIPAAGDSGEFGLAAAGQIQADALVSCAAKVIEARGGRPVTTPIGSFSTVREADQPGGGEIAVRPGGLLLLGGGPYLRAMIDSADGRTPTIRTSAAHSELGRLVGGAAARVTFVLSPEQRRSIAEELSLSGAEGAPAASILAGGLGMDIGPTIALHGVISCATAPACQAIGEQLRAARDARVEDLATRLTGFAAVLERIQFEPKGDTLHLRVSLLADEAGTLADRLLTLRGFRHPMPEPEPPEPAEPPDAAPPDAAPPGEIIRPKTGADAGSSGSRRAQ
jgi:hypothetical protein